MLARYEVGFRSFREPFIDTTNGRVIYSDRCSASSQLLSTSKR